MKESDIILLEQLIDSMNYSLRQLESAYNSKDNLGIVRTKKAILEVQEKVNYLTKNL